MDNRQRHDDHPGYSGNLHPIPPCKLPGLVREVLRTGEDWLIQQVTPEIVSKQSSCFVRRSGSVSSARTRIIVQIAREPAPQSAISNCLAGQRNRGVTSLDQHEPADLPFANGLSVSNSYSTTPSEYTSESSVTASPRACSGLA
jgi:hypothetical protein